MKNLKNKQENIQFSTISVSTLIAWFSLGKLRIDPKQQRYFVWNDEYVKELIDTLKEGWPIPTITLFKNSKGRYDVLDGRQRLTSILSMFFAEEQSESFFDKLSTDAVSRERIKELLASLVNEKLDFNSLSDDKQRDLLMYRIPIIVLDASKFDSDDYDEATSIVFDKLNRNSVQMTSENIYLSGISMLCPKKIDDISTFKTKHIVELNNALGIKTEKKIINMSLITDIRSMILLNKTDYPLMGNSHTGVRYGTELTKWENKYVNNDEIEESAAKKLAEDEWDRFSGAFKKLLAFFRENRSKIGVPTNETQRKSLIWLVLNDEIQKINFSEAIKLCDLMKRCADSETYKEFNQKSGISSPQRLYEFIKILMNVANEAQNTQSGDNV